MGHKSKVELFYRDYNYRDGIIDVFKPTANLTKKKEGINRLTIKLDGSTNRHSVSGVKG
jgi:hypothetical protein